MKSTYGIKTDSSYKNEQFYTVPLSWRCGVCSRDILKVRIAKWRPKNNRDYEAIFYFEVDTTKEAIDILNKFKDFDFIAVEDWFESRYLKDKVGHTTGVVNDWLSNVILPEARKLFKSPFDNN